MKSVKDPRLHGGPGSRKNMEGHGAPINGLINAYRLMGVITAFMQ